MYGPPALTAGSVAVQWPAASARAVVDRPAKATVMSSAGPAVPQTLIGTSALDDRVILEERAQRQRRLRPGGCGDRARGGDGEQERSAEADDHDARIIAGGTGHRSSGSLHSTRCDVRYARTAAPTVGKNAFSPRLLKRPKRFNLSITGSFISAKHSSTPAS